MKKILGLFIIPLIVTLSIGVTVSATEKNYVYKGTTKDVVVTYNEKVAKGNEIIDISFSNNGDVTKTILNPDFTTKTWEYRDKEQNTKLVAEKNGAVIQVKGRVKGKEISREFKIGNRPWYQAVNLSFGVFVLSGKDRQEFWIMQNLKGYNMVAIRDKEEILQVNGQDVAAVKVRMTLTGWVSRFWNVYYWFRKSDGLYLRYEGANGSPGTPVTVIELVNED